MPNLDEVIRPLRVDGAFPLALPVSHLIRGNELSDILPGALLLPRWCKVFKKDIVYLFYGGVFYRPSRATYFPVAFVFSQLVLKQIDQYYPFDTGAAVQNRYGPRWTAWLPPIERFAVNGNGDHATPAKMVNHFFGTNDDYLFGDASSECRGLLPEPCPVLHEFLGGVDVPKDVDQRHRTIEGHSTAAVSMEHLLWIGYPEGFEDRIALLCRQIEPIVPQMFRYKSITRHPPGYYANILQHEAHKAVIERHMNRP